MATGKLSYHSLDYLESKKADTLAMLETISPAMESLMPKKEEKKPEVCEACWPWVRVCVCGGGGGGGEDGGGVACGRVSPLTPPPPHSLGPRPPARTSNLPPLILSTPPGGDPHQKEG